MEENWGRGAVDQQSAVSRSTDPKSNSREQIRILLSQSQQFWRELKLGMVSEVEESRAENWKKPRVAEQIWGLPLSTPELCQLFYFILFCRIGCKIAFNPQVQLSLIFYKIICSFICTLSVVLSHYV